MRQALGGRFRRHSRLRLRFSYFLNSGQGRQQRVCHFAAFILRVKVLRGVRQQGGQRALFRMNQSDRQASTAWVAE